MSTQCDDTSVTVRTQQYHSEGVLCVMTPQNHFLSPQSHNEDTPKSQWWYHRVTMTTPHNYIEWILNDTTELCWVTVLSIQRDSDWVHNVMTPVTHWVLSLVTLETLSAQCDDTIVSQSHCLNVQCGDTKEAHWVYHGNTLTEYLLLPVVMRFQSDFKNVLKYLSH